MAKPANPKEDPAVQSMEPNPVDPGKPAGDEAKPKRRRRSKPEPIPTLVVPDALAEQISAAFLNGIEALAGVPYSKTDEANRKVFTMSLKACMETYSPEWLIKYLPLITMGMAFSQLTVEAVGIKRAEDQKKQPIPKPVEEKAA